MTTLENTICALITQLHNDRPHAVAHVLEYYDRCYYGPRATVLRAAQAGSEDR